MVVISAFSAIDVAEAYVIFKESRVSPWSLTLFEKSALNGISLIAKENKRILGFVILSSVLDELTIEDITVDAKHRNMGIGQQLMAASIALANKIQQTTLFLEVHCNNQPALALYRATGFEIVGERKNYYASDAIHDPDADPKTKIPPSQDKAYVMKKVL